jgi:hypothetical protein
MSNGAAPTFDIRIVIALGETTTVSCLDRDEVGIRRDAAGEHQHVDRDGRTEDVLALQGGSFARCARVAHHVRGVRKVSAFRCLPARKRNTPLDTVTSSIHEDLSGRRTR